MLAILGWKLPRAKFAVAGFTLAFTLLPGSHAGRAACDALGPFQEGRALAGEGLYAEAIEAAERSLACAEETFGDSHENLAFILDDLAVAHLKLKRFDDAKAYGERAVSIIGRARPGSVDHAKLATNLASVHAALGRYQDAEPLYRIAHEIISADQSANPSLKASMARNLAITEAELSRYQASLDLYAEAARSTEEAAGRNTPAFGQALLDLAGAHLALDQTDQAESYALSARNLIGADKAPADLVLAKVALQRSALGEAAALLEGVIDGGATDPALKASALYNLASVDILRGRFLEAEPILKEALSTYREVVGMRHPAMGRTLHSLAIVYNRLGQHDVSARFYRQALDLFRELFGEDDLTLAATKVEYAQLLKDQKDLAGAEREAREALRIYASSPSRRPVYEGFAHSSLGFILHDLGDLPAAADAFERALAIIEQARGAHSSDLPPGLIELGQIRLKQRDFAAAEGLLTRAVAIRERDVARTPWGLSKALASLAELRHVQGRSEEAMSLLERAVQTISDRFGEDIDSGNAALQHGEAMSERRIFELFLEVAYGRQLSGDDDARDAMIEVVQYTNFTETAAAIARMSARLANGGDALGRLMRDRQDAIEARRAHDLDLTEAIAAGRSDVILATLGLELASTDRRIRDIEAELSTSYPDIVALLRPRPVSTEDVQGLLAQNEAVLVQVTGDEQTHIVWIEEDHIDVAQTSLGQRELTWRVQSLLDGVSVGEEGISALTPFDVGSAHKLYQSLIAPFAERFAKVDHLIVVLDGQMQLIPPSLLLRTEADADPEAFGRFLKQERITRDLFLPFKTLDYLGRHVAISSLPSLGSLRALRQRFKILSDRRPLIGFGNPVFEGEGGQHRMARPDQLPMKADIKTRRQASKNFAPLPAAETELLELAALLGADRTDIYLRDNASETAVKTAELQRFETIAFATHAVVPGELDEAITESALILPVSDNSETEDDGILTESEIVRLEMNADWVILSACNTVAPTGRPGAEALSGLARAFFLAGSRALLVSHWAVDDNAASVLTTGTMRALRRQAVGGRAAALKAAMNALIDDPKEIQYSHPMFWAPFAVVGEGWH